MLVLQLEIDKVHAMGGIESGEAILSISLMRAVHVLVRHQKSTGPGYPGLEYVIQAFIDGIGAWDSSSS
jgi:hypothetical protein